MTLLCLFFYFFLHITLWIDDLTYIHQIIAVSIILSFLGAFKAAFICLETKKHLKELFYIFFIYNLYEFWIFSIITPVLSVTWSFRNHSNMPISCSRKYFLVLSSDIFWKHFFLVYLSRKLNRSCLKRLVWSNHRSDPSVIQTRRSTGV